MTNTKKLFADSRGAGSQEYLVAVILVGVLGVGGFKVLGGAMQKDIGTDGQGSGVVVAVQAGNAQVVTSGQAGADSDPAAAGGASVCAGLTGADLNTCLQSQLAGVLTGPSGVSIGGGPVAVDTGSASTTKGKSSKGKGKGGKAKGDDGGCGFLGVSCVGDALGSVASFAGTYLDPSHLVDQVLPGDGFLGDDGFLSKLPVVGSAFDDSSWLTDAVRWTEDKMPGGSFSCAMLFMPTAPVACMADVTKDAKSAKKGTNIHHEKELDGQDAKYGFIDGVLRSAAERAAAGFRNAADKAAAVVTSGQGATSPGSADGASGGAGGSGGSTGSGAAPKSYTPPPPPPDEEIDTDGDGIPDTGTSDPGTDDGTGTGGGGTTTPPPPVDNGTNEPVVNDPTITGPTDDGAPNGGGTDVTPEAPVDQPTVPNTPVTPMLPTNGSEGPAHIDDPTIDENGDGILDNDATPAGHIDDPTIDENGDGILDNDGIFADSDGNGIADILTDANGDGVPDILQMPTDSPGNGQGATGSEGRRSERGSRNEAEGSTDDSDDSSDDSRQSKRGNR